MKYVLGIIAIQALHSKKEHQSPVHSILTCVDAPALQVKQVLGTWLRREVIAHRKSSPEIQVYGLGASSGGEQKIWPTTMRPAFHTQNTCLISPCSSFLTCSGMDVLFVCVHVPAHAHPCLHDCSDIAGTGCPCPAHNFWFLPFAQAGSCCTPQVPSLCSLP